MGMNTKQERSDDVSAKTKISWTDMTWNPIRGCSLVSAGCANCYAMKQAHRFSGPGQPYEGLTALGPHGPRWNGTIRLVPEALEMPLHWRKPRRIFVNSMSDLFHEDVPDEFIDQVFITMGDSHRHTFQILTKRPKRMKDYMAKSEIAGESFSKWPLPNVWLGVSVEAQATADERIPMLLQTPAAIRWISAEPLLGEMDLEPYLPYSGNVLSYGGLDWVVVGGESGHDARPSHPSWIRSLRDQCRRAGTPFFFKQWGEWAPGDCVDPGTGKGRRSHYFDAPHEPGKVWRFGKTRAGAVLDGRLWRQYPEQAT